MMGIKMIEMDVHLIVELRIELNESTTQLRELKILSEHFKEELYCCQQWHQSNLWLLSIRLVCCFRSQLSSKRYLQLLQTTQTSFWCWLCKEVSVCLIWYFYQMKRWVKSHSTLSTLMQYLMMICMWKADLKQFSLSICNWSSWFNWLFISVSSGLFTR